MRVLILATILFLAGCSSQSPVTRLAEQYAVQRGVSEYINGSEAKAQRVADVTAKMLERLEGDLSSASVNAIASALKASISWQSLDPIDADLVMALIAEIELEIDKRIAGGELPPDALVAIRTVLMWAQSAARSNLESRP